jgi:hypothetical protein
MMHAAERLESVREDPQAERGLSSAVRWAIYVGLILAAVLGLPLGAALSGASTAHLTYVVLLLAICASPVILIDSLASVYTILGFAMVVYFASFGLADAVAVLQPAKQPPPNYVGIDTAEIALLLGALMQVLGFLVGVSLWKQSKSGSRKEWSLPLLLPLGLGLWVAGMLVILIQALVLQVDNSDAAVFASYSMLGVWGTTFWVAAQSYCAPLGTVIIGYWWSRRPDRKSNYLVLLIIVTQFVVGWVVDTKEVAIGAPIIFLLTRLMVTRRLPILWLVGSAVCITLVFPVLSAKREIMSESLQITRTQALGRELEILSKALGKLRAERSGETVESSQTFLERLSNKGAIETFAAHCGKDMPYKYGATLLPLVYAFIPRIVWSTKPGDNAAQTFNRDYHLSEDPDTHISPSHIGELYWNFGDGGVIVGEALMGLILGSIARRFYSDRMTLTSVLVLIVTLYELVARQEGSIGVEYVVWIRGLAFIGILHWLLARDIQLFRPAEPSAAQVASAMRFQNLMR